MKNVLKKLDEHALYRSSLHFILENKNKLIITTDTYERYALDENHNILLDENGKVKASEQGWNKLGFGTCDINVEWLPNLNTDQGKEKFTYACWRWFDEDDEFFPETIKKQLSKNKKLFQFDDDTFQAISSLLEERYPHRYEEEEWKVMKKEVLKILPPTLSKILKNISKKNEEYVWAISPFQSRWYGWLFVVDTLQVAEDDYEKSNNGQFQNFSEYLREYFIETPNAFLSKSDPTCFISKLMPDLRDGFSYEMLCKSISLWYKDIGFDISVSCENKG